MSAPLVAIAAGGTGGHVFPGTALAEALTPRGYGVAFLTDRRGAEMAAFGEAPTYVLPTAPLAGGLAIKAAGAVRLAAGVTRAALLLRRLKPAAVVGFGGYPSAPGLVAATRLRRPTLIHEQNGVLGRANRLVAPRVSLIATSLPDTEGVRPQDAHKVRLTGNPVRREVAALAERPYPTRAADQPLDVLVLGGSLGAHVLSQVVPAAVALLSPDRRERLRLTQQVRAEDLDAVRADYIHLNYKAELAPFFADVPRRLASAHLVIGRAGASTVAELTAAGRPALLVPYPHHADQHQLLNARALDRAGGAWLMPEESFTPEALASRLADLIDTPTTLEKAAACARAVGHPDAAARLADLVDELAGRNGGHREEAA